MNLYLTLTLLFILAGFFAALFVWFINTPFAHRNRVPIAVLGIIGVPLLIVCLAIAIWIYLATQVDWR